MIRARLHSLPFLASTLAASALLLSTAAAEEVTLATLSLEALAPESSLPDRPSHGGVPQTIPYVAGENASTFVTLEEEYTSSAGAVGGPGQRVIVARKAENTDPYGIRFDFGDLPISSGQLKMEMKALFEGKDQRGNIVIGFASPNGLVSYFQVGDGGIVQLIQTGGSVEALDFAALPLGTTLESLTLLLDFDTATATISLNGEPLGKGTFDANYAISAFTINMGGSSAARRTVAIERLVISHNE